MRSVPEGRSGSVSTLVPPCASTAAAIAGSAQATITGPTAASHARQTWTIIGAPPISASGLSGRRVARRRARIMTTVGGAAIGLTIMAKSAKPACARRRGAHGSVERTGADCRVKERGAAL